VDIRRAWSVPQRTGVEDSLTCTLTGAEHLAALRSYIATTHKHDLGTLQALTMLTTGNTWLPKTA